jgi:AraC-like DNA-binding protein
MKSKRSFEPHLVVKEVVLPPGSEFAPQAPGWSFFHLSRGVGYWLHPRGNHELATGSVLLLSERTQGIKRASQVGEVLLHFFRLQPQRLTGLVTLNEQQFLQNAAALEQSSLRIFRPGEAVAENFRKVCETVNGNNFRLRLQLLDLFIQAFGNELPNQTAAPAPSIDAKARLTHLLNQTPLSELLDLSFTDLVQEMRCTPRHLSRIFHEVVGMSFREKQAQVRLVRAQELLATTQCKVVEVALESGYQSLSLFNLMFKKRFGVTPGKWREQTLSQKPVKRTNGRLLAFRA